MNFVYKTAIEYSAASDLVRECLMETNNWRMMLPEAEKLSEYWEYHNELYQVHWVGDETQLVGAAVGAANPSMRLNIAITLTNTGITTHAAITAILSMPLTWQSIVQRGRIKDYFKKVCHKVIDASRALFQPDSLPVLAEIAQQYPHTFEAFTRMNAVDHLERVGRLDQTWSNIRAATASGNGVMSSEALDGVYEVGALPNQDYAGSYDLIYAGGGLGLLHAVIMAQCYGYRVLLFDRSEVGCAHREWNISREELAALVSVGFCTWAELRPIVMTEYDTGVVRFHAGTQANSAELWMKDVLDVALDAGTLLRLARQKLEAAGGVILDHRLFRQVRVTAAGPVHVAVDVANVQGAVETYRGRLLLDGMGSISPLALRRFAGQPFAGVCPTVGTVVSGLVEGDAPNEHNPRIGDILLSVADAQRGQQYMWEGFPGRDDELTVYLFYYDALNTRTAKTSQTLSANGQNSTHPKASYVRQSPNLLELFEDYFALLPTYKLPGPDFQHVKPVYGYIPGRHSVNRQEAPLLRGVLPVGDSAAQQSPLTFCGFGSHVRNLDRTTSLLDETLRQDLLEPHTLRVVNAYQINVSLNWVFSRFMQPWGTLHDVNLLQNIFLGVLNDLGEDFARRFFRDQMVWSDYHQMLLGVFWRYPRIVLIAWQVLGPDGVRQWISDYLVYSCAALVAWWGHQIGRTRLLTLAETLSRVAPRVGLRLRSALAEWKAMGWG
ncbi:MAG: Dehydrogenase (flavoprotein) [Chloroflexi bacterium AL-W]|nr:Dehydrogenase (flavoprotein) [Chloroflexi bacterium AL-N1]NOK65124.1 Dehydrogenase (flavoprotein) [Chloroflexi bacterium AL-N10]NOK72609.1 Dehydrogenase (flavoprotein) [Chloroflexi bacterium AL-N5]NOK79303.1 Dehydrogenase (flavoprotein) [Chloroflexi bacterium AL-W]NOK87219.1 Dehydrogenase (flavoprotein) [Chloroflexi bacterium AL-N15]